MAFYFVERNPLRTGDDMFNGLGLAFVLIAAGMLGAPVLVLAVL